MNSTPQNKNTTLTMLLVILAVIAGYLYYSQIIKPDIGLVVPPLSSGKDDLIHFKDLKVDFSIFDRKEFKSTRLFGEVPVSPGESGKIDLFSSF